MSPARWLVLVGCQAWVWSLCAQERRSPPVPRPAMETPGMAGHDPWYCRLLERSTRGTVANRGAYAHGRPGGRVPERPPAPAVQGPSNLVLEVRRLELDDANGAPRGTYR